jgi:uncharacterized protein (TIGR04255 family)
VTAVEHEIYEHAPVALVAVEVRFPGEIGGPVPPGVQHAFRESLGSDWINEQIQQPTLTVNVNGPQPFLPGVVGGLGGFAPGAILRFTVRDRSTAVSVTGGSVTVETTQYGNWPQFRSILKQAIVATSELLRPEGIVRAGLRYIDEVRIVPANDQTDWSDWLTSAVLAPAATSMAREDCPPVSWTGAAQYHIGEDRSMVLRYGPQPGQPGFAINPDGPIRRIGFASHGPFFLLDFDAFWQPASVPEWRSADLLEVFDDLRKPVRTLFDEIITPRLEEEVFQPVGTNK